MTTARQDAIEQSLRRRIAADPDDIEARLVYADFVEESGFRHHAAMTRAQVAWRGMARDDPGWLVVQADIQAAARDAEVGDYNAAGQLPDTIGRYWLIDSWLTRPAELLEHGPRCLREHPIETVDLVGPAPALPAIERVRRLKAHDIAGLPGALPGSLEHLGLLDPRDESIRALVSAADLGSLTSLDIGRDIDDEVAGAIGRSPLPLERLRLNLASAAGAAAIADRPLRTLSLSGSGNGAPPLSPTIERLELRLAGLGRGSIRPVFARGLEPTDLLLELDPIDAAALGELFESASLDRLERLSLRHTAFDDEAMAVLCGHPVIEQLTELDISNNRLATGLETLARSRSRGLRALDISGRTCDSRGLRELLESPVSDSLVYLGFYGVADPDAVALLLEPGVVPNLRWISNDGRVYRDAGLDVPRAAHRAPGALRHGPPPRRPVPGSLGRLTLSARSRARRPR